MDAANVIDRYFEALENQDVAAMVELFSNDSLVASPIFGTMEPDAFFLMLFTLSKWSRAEVHRVTEEKNTDEGAAVLAAHFRYRSKPLVGKMVEFDCVDYFEFASNGRIRCLTPVFDSEKVRIPMKKILKKVFQKKAAIRSGS